MIFFMVEVIPKPWLLGGWLFAGKSDAESWRSFSCPDPACIGLHAVPI
jgi:hypothetical protein